VATVSDGLDVAAAVHRHEPDILLLDLSLPHRTGLEILGDLHTSAPAVRVVVVTMHVDTVLVDSALRLGASAFVPKDAHVDELHTAIDEVMQGRRYVSPRLPKQTYGEVTDRMGFDQLTERQQEIVRMIGRGMTTPDVAAALGITENTVQFHRKNIRRRLGIDSDFGMLRYALLVELSEDPPTA
jgi:DNA-binding NarL/FixJ family response regulator